MAHGLASDRHWAAATPAIARPPHPTPRPRLGEARDGGRLRGEVSAQAATGTATAPGTPPAVSRAGGKCGAAAAHHAHAHHRVHAHAIRGQTSCGPPRGTTPGSWRAGTHAPGWGHRGPAVPICRHPPRLRRAPVAGRRTSLLRRGAVLAGGGGRADRNRRCDAAVTPRARLVPTLRHAWWGEAGPSPTGRVRSKPCPLCRSRGSASRRTYRRLLRSSTRRGPRRPPQRVVSPTGRRPPLSRGRRGTTHRRAFQRRGSEPSPGLGARTNDPAAGSPTATLLRLLLPLLAGHRPNSVQAGCPTVPCVLKHTPLRCSKETRAQYWTVRGHHAEHSRARADVALGTAPGLLMSLSCYHR